MCGNFTDAQFCALFFCTTYIYVNICTNFFINICRICSDRKKYCKYLRQNKLLQIWLLCPFIPFVSVLPPVPFLPFLPLYPLCPISWTDETIHVGIDFKVQYSTEWHWTGQCTILAILLFLRGPYFKQRSSPWARPVRQGFCPRPPPAGQCVICPSHGLQDQWNAVLL